MSKQLKRDLDGKLAKVPESVAKKSKFKTLSSKLSKALGGNKDFFDDLEKLLKEVATEKKKVKGNKDDEANIAKVEALLADGKKKHLKFKAKSTKPK